MRRQIIGATLLITAVFGAGYLAGQAGGIGAGLAAAKPHQTAPPAGTTAACPKPGAFGGFHHGRGAGGQVTAVNGESITVKPFNRPNDADAQTETRPTTILLTSSTTYVGAQGAAAKQSDIKVGSYIAAPGTVSADGKTVTATTVFIFSGAPTGLHAHGLWGHDWSGTAPAFGGAPGA